MSRIRECHHDLLEREMTERVIGIFFRVYNALGYGFAESVYAKAMELEMVGAGLHVTREAPVEVRFKGEVVGVFRADALVESRLVLEFKASAKLQKPDWMQLLNYLRCTDLELGLLLHFGPRPAFKRIIATNHIPGEGDPRSLRSPSAASAWTVVRRSDAGRASPLTAAPPPAPGPRPAPPPAAYPSP